MDEFITLAHGSGGEKSEELIKNIILPELGNSKLNSLSDGALLQIDGKIAFSTDSFVINPLFFSGGDIGKLAVCGTCNDLLMCGSIPKYLSLSLIIEEGLEVEILKRIIHSIAETAKQANINIVTGDTKVVDKGAGDGIYINTSGIGIMEEKINLDKNRIEAGDKVIISGDIGDHGIAIMCEREGYFETSVKSDCNYLYEVVAILFEYGDKIKILRDPTRGGVATTLNEFVDGTDYSIELLEEDIPFSDGARGASEILGIDLLYSANEGKVVAIVAEDIADEILIRLKQTNLGANASIIGEVVNYDKEKVLLKGRLGTRRIISKLASDLFPRIC